MLTIACSRYGNTIISNKALQELSDKASAAMVRWKDNLPDKLTIPNGMSSAIVPQLLVLQYVNRFSTPCSDFTSCHLLILPTA